MSEKKSIHVRKLKELAKRKGLKILTNVSYKENFNVKDQVRVKHSCGLSNTMTIRRLRHYKCDCQKQALEKSKVCILCEKPHKGATKLCAYCNKKKNQLDTSIRKLIVIQEKYKVKDVFSLLDKKPYILYEKINKEHAIFLKREKRRKIEESYSKSVIYDKWTTETPQYVYDLFTKKPHYQLITISGDKLNPNIHYVCHRCNQEQCQKFKDLSSNSGHDCEGSKSSGEIAVEKFLKDKNIPYVIQRETLSCLNPITNRQLPYDFEIKGKKILIEVQGKQHFEFTQIFHGTIENFEYQLFRDNFKKQFAEKQGYQIIYINYDELSDGSFRNKILYALK